MAYRWKPPGIRCDDNTNKECANEVEVTMKVDDLDRDKHMELQKIEVANWLGSGLM
jgi:hypothetical protein